MNYPKTNSPFKRDPETKLLQLNEPSRQEFLWLAGAPWYATEKLDGSCHQLTLWKEYSLFFSRNGASPLAPLPESVTTHIPKLIEAFGEGTTLFGELIGPKIQGNKYKLETHQFRVFAAHGSNGWWPTQSVINTIQSVNPDLGVPIVKDPFAGADLWGGLDEWTIALHAGKINGSLGDYIEGIVLHLQSPIDLERKPIICKIRKDCIDRAFPKKKSDLILP